MDKQRIAEMTNNIVADVTAENFVPTMFTAAASTSAPVGPDDDVAYANVDQALDTMLAAIRVIEDNLPAIKTNSVPERAAVDAVKDLIATGVKPYFADVLKVMQVFGS